MEPERSSTAPSSSDNTAVLPSSNETAASIRSDSSLLRPDVSLEELKWNWILSQSATRALFQDQDKDSSSSSSYKIDSKSENGENMNTGGSLSFHDVPILRKRQRSITASDFNFTDDEEQIARSDSRLSDLVLFLNDKTTAQISRITELEHKNDELVFENETITNELVQAEIETQSMKKQMLKMTALLKEKDDEIEQKKSHITFLEVVRSCQDVRDDGLTNDETRASSTIAYSSYQKTRLENDDFIDKGRLPPSTPWGQPLPQHTKKRWSLPTVSTSSIARIDSVPSTLAKEGVLTRR